MASDDERYQVQGRNGVQRLLTSLQQARVPVSLRFDDTQDSHLSMLVAVDGKGGRFYLDEVALPRGRRQAEAGAVFSIHAELEGVPIEVTGCRITGQAPLDGVDAYIVPFPSSLVYRQRRDEFRARVPRAMNVPVSLGLPARAPEQVPPLTGILGDLSASGCRVEFPRKPATPVESGQCFGEVVIDAPEPYGRLEMSAEACHVLQDEEGRTAACGFRFLEVRGGTSQRLQKFLLHLQREALRLQRD